MKIIYVSCGVKNYLKGDRRSYVRFVCWDIVILWVLHLPARLGSNAALHVCRNHFDLSFKAAEKKNWLCVFLSAQVN